MKNETFCTVLLSTNSLVPSYYLTLNLETIGYIEITEIMTEYYWNVTYKPIATFHHEASRRFKYILRCCLNN